jgi:hypothetical protein
VIWHLSVAIETQYFCVGNQKRVIDVDRSITCSNEALKQLSLVWWSRFFAAFLFFEFFVDVVIHGDRVN